MARRRPLPTDPQPALILDSGAVLALAQADVRTRAFVQRARELGAEVMVPAVVVGEITRGNGPRDAAVNRILKAVGEIPAAVEETGRMAGALLAAAGSAETIDAFVVAEAVLRHSAQVLTGDPDDLRPLAAAHPAITIRVVGRG